MDFTLSPELSALQARVRTFIAEEVIPLERDPRCTPHGPNETLRAELIDKGRRAGLLSSHVSRAFGGLGLGHVAKAVFFEEAGYSPLGPVALNIAAPDEGNMHLLEAIATPAQKERWLRPLAAGDDPLVLLHDRAAARRGRRTRRCCRRPPARDGDDYVINGSKWFITGARRRAARDHHGEARRTARPPCSSPT